MAPRGRPSLLGGSDSDSEAEQRNPMEAMFAKLTEKLTEKMDAKMDAFMQEVTRKVAGGTQKETPRVFQVGEGSGTSSCIPNAIPIVSVQETDSMDTRPTMPTFTEEEAEQTASREEGPDLHAVWFADWRSLGPEFMEALPFNQYMQYRGGSKPHDRNKGRGSHRDSNRAASKFHLPMFDGSPKTTARSWVEKLDLYFQLNQMPEKEAIKMAALHLEGEA